MSPQRRSIRLSEYDYSFPGAYFVSLATWQRENLFGEIIEDHMRLSCYGRVAQGELTRLSQRFPRIQVDEFIVMPDHVHVILWILAEAESVRASPVGARQKEPTIHPNQPLASPIPPTGSAGEDRARLTDSASNSNRDSASPLQIHWVPIGAAAGTLGAIIGAYKSTTARIINGLRRTPGAPVWQRNYYEHVIRNEQEWDSIRRYIQANPHNRPSDHENSPS